MKSPRPSRQGFTLIEVALALLVIGLGIVAVFGLFPSGLEASRRTMNETQAALFAEEVFGAYRAASRLFSWSSFNSIQVPIAASNFWEATPAVKFGNGTVAWRDLSDTNLVERAIRYQLTAVNSDSDQAKLLTLTVFPGEFGGTQEAYTFHTLIVRMNP